MFLVQSDPKYAVPLRGREKTTYKGIKRVYGKMKLKDMFCMGGLAYLVVRMLVRTPHPILEYLGSILVFSS